MRVIICGGRSFRDYLGMFTFLDQMEITEIAHGDAPGADTAADVYATLRDIPVQRFPADWHTLGRKAGPIRNQSMYDSFKPEAIIAFPGGNGTAHMVSYAVSKGCKVINYGT